MGFTGTHRISVMQFDHRISNETYMMKTVIGGRIKTDMVSKSRIIPKYCYHLSLPDNNSNVR